MYKAIVRILIVGLLLVMTAMPALAGGDKVRGDLGQGDVNQVQIQDPPPFQP